MLTLGTFCSGIGAPEVASQGFMRPIWASEIEPFPIAVLAARFPGVPNLGDMTAPDLVERIAAIGLPDVVVAGLPCQPFSVAGLRKGEADPRNLTARFVEIADAVDDLRRDNGQPPVWWLVENVPGLLNDSGNAFGALLGGMVGSDAALVPGGRWESAGVADGPRRLAAWRVLDAQHFGVAQRRRRVFALFVGGAGKWAAADALLPITDRLSWHSAPRRGTGQVAPTIPSRSLGGGGLGTDCDGGLIPFDTTQITSALNRSQPKAGDPCHPLAAGAHAPAIAGTLDASFGRLQGCSGQDANHGHSHLIPLGIAHSLRGEGFDASEDGTGWGTPLVPVCFSSKDHGADAMSDLSPTLRAGGHSESHANAGVPPAIAFHPTQDPIWSADGSTHAMGTGSKGGQASVAVAFNAYQRTVGGDVADPLMTGAGGVFEKGVMQPMGATGWAVRRLTPTECERLQGFPDGFTAVPWRGKDGAPDGPRYKSLGNSMAVPCIRWIMDRMRLSMEASR